MSTKAYQKKTQPTRRFTKSPLKGQVFDASNSSRLERNLPGPPSCDRTDEAVETAVKYALLFDQQINCQFRPLISLGWSEKLLYQNTDSNGHKEELTADRTDGWQVEESSPAQSRGRSRCLKKSLTRCLGDLEQLSIIPSSKTSNRCQETPQLRNRNCTSAWLVKTKAVSVSVGLSTTLNQVSVATSVHWFFHVPRTYRCRKNRASKLWQKFCLMMNRPSSF